MIFNAETQRHRGKQVISKKAKGKISGVILSVLFFFFSSPFSASLRLCLLILPAVFGVSAQSKIAVLVPEKNVQSQTFAGALEDSLASSLKVLDNSLSEAAYRSKNYEKPFNLSLDEAKGVGLVAGCDYFLLIKAENLRRNSLSKGEFYESYAVVFTVSSRTGRLVFWKLNSFESANQKDADKKLFDSIDSLSSEISAKLKIAKNEESNEKPARNIEKLPEENSSEAKNFRPPLPYKRFRPAYTPIANLYAVEATVDAEIDIDENGKILKVEIVRWAGFGLDDSVAETIKKMNWRPAERNGKTLPMRVLLRYNFKKIESE